MQNNPTATPRARWLDGLRGLAALIVCFNHLIVGELEMPYRSYWAEPATANRHLIQLPFFRLIFTRMANIFMVASAYAMSSGLIRRRDRDLEVFYRTLSSSAFRRIFRLMMPVVFMTVTSHVLWYCGAYSGPFATFPDPRRPEALPGRNPMAHVQSCLLFLGDTLNLVDPRLIGGLNDNLWTVPFELRGSFIVYLFLLATAPIKARVRKFLLVVLSAYFLVYRLPDTAAFFAGALLGELGAGSELAGSVEEKEKQQGPSRKSSSEASSVHQQLSKNNTKPQNSRTTLAIPAFLLGIYFMALPLQDPISPGYHWLTALPAPRGDDTTNTIRSSYTVGAFFLIYGIGRLPLLQLPLTTRPVLFLGRMSFSIYLVHQTVFRMWRAPLLSWVCRVLNGKDYAMTRRNGDARDVVWMAWAVTTSVLFAAVLVFAACMTRWVDRRSMIWTRWLEEACQRN